MIRSENELSQMGTIIKVGLLNVASGDAQDFNLIRFGAMKSFGS